MSEQRTWWGGCVVPSWVVFDQSPEFVRGSQPDRLIRRPADRSAHPLGGVPGIALLRSSGTSGPLVRVHSEPDPALSPRRSSADPSVCILTIAVSATTLSGEYRHPTWLRRASLPPSTAFTTSSCLLFYYAWTASGSTRLLSFTPSCLLFYYAVRSRIKEQRTRWGVRGRSTSSPIAHPPDRPPHRVRCFSRVPSFAPMDSGHGGVFGPLPRRF